MFSLPLAIHSWYVEVQGTFTDCIFMLIFIVWCWRVSCKLIKIRLDFYHLECYSTLARVHFGQCIPSGPEAKVFLSVCSNRSFKHPQLPLRLIQPVCCTDCRAGSVTYLWLWNGKGKSRLLCESLKDRKLPVSVCGFWMSYILYNLKRLVFSSSLC